MSKEEKKNRTIGIIITSVTHLAVILLLFAFTMGTEAPEEDPVLLIMDFTETGSSSRGGSSSAAAESQAETTEPQQAVEPVTTQKTKSPVKKSDKKASTSSSSTTKADRKANSAASAAGAFGGNGNGEGEGDGDGNNSGIGQNDGTGPGLKGFGTIGTGDGSNPTFNNPTQEEGKVLVKLFVNRSGKVTSVEVLSAHKKTTTSDAVLLNKAKRDGAKYVFSANSGRPETSIAYRLINYRLQ